MDDSVSLAEVVMSVERAEPDVVDCSAVVEPDSVLLVARVVSVEVAEADSVAEPLWLTVTEVSVEVPDKDSAKLDVAEPDATLVSAVVETTATELEEGRHGPA